MQYPILFLELSLNFICFCSEVFVKHQKLNHFHNKYYFCSNYENKRVQKTMTITFQTKKKGLKLIKFLYLLSFKPSLTKFILIKAKLQNLYMANWFERDLNDIKAEQLHTWTNCVQLCLKRRKCSKEQQHKDNCKYGDLYFKKRINLFTSRRRISVYWRILCE